MCKIEHPFSGTMIFIIWLAATTGYAQDSESGSSLKKAFEESTKKVTISDNYEDIPPHQIYRSVFIKALLNPEFGRKFNAEDWEIIYALPSHNDVKFIEYARNVLMDSCSRIIRVKGIDSRSAIEIGTEFEQAKSKIVRQLDQHYEVVLNAISDSGKSIVYGEILEKIETGLVTYSDINFAYLGAIEPEFTVKFLAQSCRNVEVTPSLNHQKILYLRDVLSESYKAGSVEDFSPEEIN